MAEVVTFGETMVRLSTPRFHRLEQTPSLDMRPGGAEANVAVALARLGTPVAYVTRMTRNPLGRFIEDQVRASGVDTSHILWTDEDRVGLYFVEFGASPRASVVYYDRKDSAMSRLQPGDVDWVAVMAGARHFHTSGITPALSDSCRAATVEALQSAKDAGLTVSIDLNYRSKLWPPEEAQATMTELMQYADFLVTSEGDGRDVFGIAASNRRGRRPNCRQLAETLADTFKVKVVAITTGAFISQWRSQLTAVMLAEGEFYETKTYDLEIVDRLGTGDSCTAGFLWGWLRGEVQRGLDVGVALGALKQSAPGDFPFATLEEAETLAHTPGKSIAR